MVLFIMKKIIRTNPLGQSLVLVAIAMIVMIALAALLLDGGQLYMNRRAAQSAADAAALAGAYEMCIGDGVEAGIQKAEHYAISENGATTATASIEPNGTIIEGKIINELVVETTWTADSFFAGIFGIDQATVSATAAAACFTPGGEHLLPIAWACRKPWMADGSDNTECQIDALDWTSEMQPLINQQTGTVSIHGYDYPIALPFKMTGKEVQGARYLDQYIYVVMDGADVADDLTQVCSPIGTMPCDINGDGRNDLLGGGDRSWIQLDGDARGGASSLIDWIRNGYEGVIQPHIWLPGQSGIEAATFSAVEDFRLEGNIALIPVFNAICTDNPTNNTECVEAAHQNVPLLPGEVEIYPEGSATTYYHIIAFAKFYITCVESAQHGPCPAHEAAATAGLIPKNSKTIEGYFVTGVPVNDSGISEGGLDMGVYVVSLTR